MYLYDLQVSRLSRDGVQVVGSRLVKCRGGGKTFPLFPAWKRFIYTSSAAPAVDATLQILSDLLETARKRHSTKKPGLNTTPDHTPQCKRPQSTSTVDACEPESKHRAVSPCMRLCKSCRERSHLKTVLYRP